MSSMCFTRAGSGASPSSVLSVSRTMPMPPYKMNTATPRPITPSTRAMPVSLVTNSDTSTAAVEITSLRLSAAVAISTSESIMQPMRRLKAAIQSFTRIDAASTATLSQLNAAICGCQILPRLSLPSSKPMTRIITETARAAIYS